MNGPFKISPETVQLLQAVQSQKVSETSDPGFASNDNSISNESSFIYTGTSFDNPVFRAEVESRLSVLKPDSSFGEFGRVYQYVPVLPGVLEVKFCTQCSEEQLWFEQNLPTGKADTNWCLHTLAVHTRVIKGTMVSQIPGYVPDVGLVIQEPYKISGGSYVWDETVFRNNVQKLKFLPQFVINILMPQLWWFWDRVQNMLKDLQNFTKPT